MAATLWPGAAGPAARANLRTAIWALRKAVGDDALITSRTAVGLRPEAVTVDLADGLRRAADGDADAAAALCRGELLPGYAEDWAETARRRQRAELAETLAARSAAAERDGDAAGAARWSRLRCELDPLNEAAHADLIRQLAAAGDRAGALVAGREADRPAARGAGRAARPGRCARRWPRPAVPARPRRRPATATVLGVPAAVRAGRRAPHADGGLGGGAGRARARGPDHRRGRDRQDPPGRGAGPARGERRGQDRGRRRRRRRRRGAAGHLAGAGAAAGPRRAGAAGGRRLAGRARPAGARHRHPAGPGPAAAAGRPRRSWSGCACSTRCCGWSSGPRPAGRCSWWPRTCTAPTGPACSCARTSAGGWPPGRCCSC